MQEAKSSGNTNPNYTLLSFKPRQVILAERNSETKMAKKDHNKTTPTQSTDRKTLLLHSILGYLERNGFSKTLQRFLSEAQIENDNWRTSSVDLEDMCCKYLETCGDVDIKFNTSKEQESRFNGVIKVDRDRDCVASEKTTSKKKKKNSDDEPTQSDKNVEDILANDKVAESKVKSKEKKKIKRVSDPHDQTDQISSEALTKTAPADDTVCELQVDESNKKYKDKKKKKKKRSTLISESVDGNLEKQQLESLQGVIEDKSNHLVSSEGDSKFECEENAKSKDKKKKNKLSIMNLSENADKENEVLIESTKEIQQTSEDVTNKERKDSKKRKRLASNENESQSVEKVAIEDPKRRKTEDSEEAKITEQTSVEHANGKLEKNGEDESALQKTRRKQLNGSAEPKTVNAFQRVKVDDVEFANDRLQDNSYWAKDGAEIGYGAKAQEILGQVRGRDFRHEKTKKKRGSYRGGNIDLHSHSVKFNYSDED